MYNSSSKWAIFYDRLGEKARSLVDPSTGMLSPTYSEDRRCPVCESGSFVARFVKDGFRYVTCDSCGLVYINPQLTQDALNRVYNDKELRLFFMNEILLTSGESDQRKEFESRIKTIATYTSNSYPRLIDIGCAAGNFMMIANDHGFAVEGIELDKLYVDYATATRGLVVHKQPLWELDIHEGAFDVVTMWDILEHLPDPMRTLSEAARVLSHGGILAFTTINHECINQRMLKDRWRYWMPPDHICSFTPEILKSMLGKAGFSIVHVKHTYMFEIIEENYLRFLSLSADNDTAAKVSNKVKKGASFVLGRIAQGIFETLKSGDIIMVIARKI